MLGIMPGSASFKPVPYVSVKSKPQHPSVMSSDNPGVRIKINSMQEWCFRCKSVCNILVYERRFALTSRKIGTIFKSGLYDNFFHYE